MTEGVGLFIFIILLWLLTGITGVIKCKDEGINWCIIIFMCFVPFIPVVARVCGLI